MEGPVGREVYVRVSEDTNDRPTNEPKPAVWPMALVLFLAPVAVSLVVSIAVVLAVLISPSGTGASFAEQCKDWIPAHSGTMTGVLVLVVAAQATILGIAYASSRGRSLGFTRWNASGATIALAVIGTLGIQWASATVFQLLRIEPSEHLRDLWKLLAVPGAGARILVGLLVSVLPAICEEALFRGVGQRRFLERWSPFAAIGVAGALFAVSHGDVQHAIMVFPLGLWFGFVAWRTTSTRASALCHAANNAFAIVVGRIWGDPDTGNLPLGAPFVAAGLLLCACTVLAARALLRGSSPS
jgi:membrane protease YdiL (CAAX protease family)